MMPLAPGANVSINETSIAGEIGHEGVSVTLTPASGWLALANFPTTEGGTTEHGEIGNPLTVTAPAMVSSDNIKVRGVLGAAGTFPPGEGETDSCRVQLQITSPNRAD